MNYSYSNHLN